MRDGRREGSLLGVLDRTVTAMGSRLLADWLANPLTDRGGDRARLDAVGELVGDPAAGGRAAARAAAACTTCERLLARVTTGRAVAARSELPGPHAALGCRAQGQADRPQQSAAWPQLEARLDLCPGLASQARQRRWPTIARWSAATAASSAPASHAELDDLRELAARRQAVDRPLPGRGDRADRHPEPQGRLQQGLRLLPRRSRTPTATRFPPTTSASRRSRTPSATSRRS